MEEIEAKILEVDPDEIAEKLDAIGAKHKFDTTVRSRFYDFPDGRIEQNGLLRLRTVNDTAFVTLKRPLDYEHESSQYDVKRLEEIEFTVNDPSETEAFFYALGMEKIHESEKRRQKWVKDGTEYVIDHYPGMPPLLEVEAPDEQALESAFHELGYDMVETVPYDYEGLLQHYGLDP